MSSQDIFVCPLCSKHIPGINRVIHQAQCRGRPAAPEAWPIVNATPAVPTTASPSSITMPPSLPIPVASTVPYCVAIPTPQDISTAVDLTQELNVGENEDIVRPFWPCPICTFHNFDCSTDICDACGSMSRQMNNNQYSVPSAPPLFPVGDLPSGLASFPTSSSDWQCSYCTCSNDRSMDRCQACDNIRPPLASQRDQLVSDDLPTDQFQHFAFTDYFHDSDDNGRASVQLFRSSSHVIAPLESSAGTSANAIVASDRSNNQSNILSSALIGAGLGAGFALLQRRNVFRGAMEGMGMGLVGGIVANAIDDTMQPTSSSSSNLRDASRDESYPPILRNGPIPRTDLINLLEMHMEISQLINALQQGGGSSGLEPTDINQLPSYTYHTSNDEINHINSNTNSCTGSIDCGSTASSDPCIICLEAFKEGDELRSLPCSHRFHTTCIDRWLQQRASCPVCKHSIRL